MPGLGGLALVLLLLFGRLPSEAAWATVLANAAHGPVCALLAVIVMSAWRAFGRAETSLLWRGAWSVVAVVVLGAAIELLQATTGRDAELTDLLTDAVGALAGAGCYSAMALRDSRRRGAWRVALAVAVFFAFVGAAPVMKMVAAYLATSLRWPVLADANRPLGMYFMGSHWITGRVEALPAAWQAATGKRAGYRVELENKQRWGLSLCEFRGNWQSAQWLIVAMVNPTDMPLHLNVRVFDRDDGLSNRLGWITTIAIAARAHVTARLPVRAMTAPESGQALDLEDIKGIVIEAEPDNLAQEFFILELSLR